MKILLAVDGSEHSRAAAHVLTHVADPQVILFHVIDCPIPLVSWDRKIEGMLERALEQRLKDEAHRLLDDLAGQVSAQTVASKQLEEGKPLERIVEAAREGVEASRAGAPEQRLPRGVAPSGAAGVGVEGGRKARGDRQEAIELR